MLLEPQCTSSITSGRHPLGLGNVYFARWPHSTQFWLWFFLLVHFFGSPCRIWLLWLPPPVWSREAWESEQTRGRWCPPQGIYIELYISWLKVRKSLKDKWWSFIKGSIFKINRSRIIFKNRYSYSDNFFLACLQARREDFLQRYCQPDVKHFWSEQNKKIFGEQYGNRQTKTWDVFTPAPKW